MRLMVKDMWIDVDLAHEFGVASPLAERAVALWEGALATLPHTADHTEIPRRAFRESVGDVRSAGPVGGWPKRGRCAGALRRPLLRRRGYGAVRG
ncbi:hypothetical protein ACFY1U_28150 [Streptomyces sp. NPDC001351]|uniref:hypothetical protein n=1 Tax=Streptomyces sp. NPDC001351 TaxID=3364564 RepID=UPI0036B96FFE